MLFIISAVVVLGILIHFRAKIQVWTACFAFFLFYWMLAGSTTTETWRWIALILFASGAALFNIPSIRRPVLIKPILKLFRRMMPPLSQTEREALEAGTVWWDGELFTGNPDWNKLLAMPKPALTDEEQFFLDNTVEELCLLLDDHQISENRDLSAEIWQFIRGKGFFGIIIPKEYGGLGFSALAHSQVVLKIASRSITAAVTVMVPNALGPAELLLNYGTDKQKQHYLPRLARGEEIPCLALTGPEAGSDAASIPDTGVVCRGDFQGKEITGIRINWEKRYITLGPVATLLGLAFRLQDPEHLLGGDENPGITMALIPADTPGITIGNRHNPLGVPFQNGPNRGKDVFIPFEWILGGKAGIGRGWQMIMECLAAGRSISMPGLSMGVGKFTAKVVGAYAGVRRQFRLPIGRFEGIEEVIARIAGSIYIMDAARMVTCRAVDSGEKPAVISAIIKYYCTEQMRKVVNDGMDVLGGSGICLGPRNMLGRIYQAAPIGITVEGANILTRSMIIFGQGAIRCHPYLLQQMHAAIHPDPKHGLVTFDRLLGRHMAFAFYNALHAFLSGVIGRHLSKSPGISARCYYRAARRFSSALALATDLVLLTLGGALKKRERISARLADVVIHLYLISALLKRFKDKEAPRDELPLLQWGCETCLHEIQESFTRLFRNLPSRPAVWLLRLLIFPLGRSFHGPSDKLCSRIAGILMKPTELRNRLVEGIFIPADESDPFCRLEDALKKAIAAEPVEQKLRAAGRKGQLEKMADELQAEAGVIRGIINEDEAGIVRQAASARRKVIRVDEFPHL